MKAKKKLPPLKVAFVGASYLFVHKVARDFLLTGLFEDAHLAILDIDKKPLKLEHDVIRKMIKQMGSTMTVEATMDRRTALKGADFVVVSISVGHPQAYANEVDICKKYGIRHIIGDTMGPAALSRNLRVVPVMLDIARDMEKLCPKAWMLNFTNPMSVLTAAVNRFSKIPCIGMCHGTYGTLKWIADAYGTTVDKIRYEMAGVNHFAYITKLWVDGKRIEMDDLYRALTKTKAVAKDLAAIDIKEGHTVQLGTLKRFGALPNNADRHTMEFLPWFITPNKKWGNQYIAEKLSVPARIKRKKWFHDTLSNWTYKRDLIPDMDRFSGEDAHSIMISLVTDDRKKHTVNVLNAKRAFVPRLPEHTCVEALARVGRKGIEPIKNDLPEPLVAQLYPITINHDLTARAAATGDRELALQALHMDPLVKDWDTIPALLDELIEANKKWLPQFRNTKPLTRRTGKR